MTDKNPAKAITINGMTVEVSQPYAEGQTITAAEAAALNQTRSEAIRNNCAKIVKTALGEDFTYPEGADGKAKAAHLAASVEALGAEAVGEINSAIATYDAEYEFTLASVGGGRKTRDPIEAAASRIAAAAIAGALKAKGRTVKQAKEDNADGYAELLANVMASADVQKAAKKEVADRSKIAEGALADINL